MRATQIPPLTRFEREAAIKVLISDRDRLCRFEQEAHVAAEDLRYDHNSVANCYWHELVSMSVRFVAIGRRSRDEEYVAFSVNSHGPALRIDIAIAVSLEK